MRFVNRVLCVLACAVSIGGTVVPARNANAQTLPPSAACVAACAVGIGDCVTMGVSTLHGCLAACGRNRPGCVQACAAAQPAFVAMCRAAFDGCVAACPTS